MWSTTAAAALVVLFGLISISVQANISPFITNGQAAGRKQFPYQIALYGHDQFFICGGCLISDQWVLTAAHCIDKNTTGVYVQLGAWNISAKEEGRKMYFVPIADTIVHENFILNRTSNFNDIALIKLPQAIEFNDYIHSIDLPEITKPFPTFVGDFGTMSGWGRLSDDPDNYPDILQWAKMTVINNTICEKVYRSSVRDSNICVSTKEGKSTCSGDSGGPFILDGNKPILIGISSFSASKCVEGIPIVLTRITFYLEWINKQIAAVNL